MASPRHRTTSIAVASILLAGGFIVPLAAPTVAAPLDIRIAYSPAFDTACARVRGYSIEPAWRAELEARLPELRRSWATDGKPLLDRASQLAGRRLTGRHDVRLTLCDLPSSSWLGTTVNMRHALQAFTRDPVPIRYKAEIIAHELLHELIADRDLSGSRLLAAQARESDRVRDHLHLLALMEAALVAGDRPAALKELRRIDGSLPGGAYRRAWQIIDATAGGYRAYVAELRQAPD